MHIKHCRCFWRQSFVPKVSLFVVNILISYPLYVSLPVYGITIVIDGVTLSTSPNCWSCDVAPFGEALSPLFPVGESVLSSVLFTIMLHRASDKSSCLRKMSSDLSKFVLDPELTSDNVACLHLFIFCKNKTYVLHRQYMIPRSALFGCMQHGWCRSRSSVTAGQ